MRSRRPAVAVVVLLLLAALVAGSRLASAATSTTTVAEDTYVSQARPTATHGGYSYLAANGPSQERRVYLKLNVTDVPTGATSVTATLRLWAEASSTATFSVHAVPSAWTEAALTWNTQPILGTRVTTRSGVTSGAYNTFNLTSHVTGRGTYAVAITKSTSGQVNFTSKESSAQHPPQLVMTWTPPATTTTVAPTTTTVPTTTVPTTTTVPAGDPVLAAAGDIACSPGGAVTPTSCHQRATSDLLLDSSVTAVQTLGDLQYPTGALADFNGSYDPSWGRVKAKTHPGPGNHEYDTPGASGYFAYFGAAAGDPAKGYYSYDLGGWHVVVLNSEIDHAAGSAQHQWLAADLAAHPSSCTLAAWHRPRFTSGANHAGDASLDPFWRTLYGAGADVVLTGHNHNYERFAPQTPDATADPARGIRQFVVGTGGVGHYGFGAVAANSQVRHTGTFGVLKLTLHPSSYDWAFTPEAGQSFTDTGSSSCH